MKRRSFIKRTAFAGISGLILPRLGYSFPVADQGELLYNGIRLPEIWPPRDMDPKAYRPMPVPYLDQPPAVIPIDIGRQLFVDHFLIEKTEL